MKDKDELFVITMEECGEVTQACSKILRRGSENPGKENLQALSDEVGDVMCMIELLVEYGYLEADKLLERVAVKREKLKRWSNLRL